MKLKEPPQRAAEDKRLEEQRAAEQDRAEKEQNAAANLTKSEELSEAAEKRAAESYKIMPRGMLSGQVFVATKGGENFKLGAVQVSLFARDAIASLVTPEAFTRAYFGAKAVN